MELMVNQEMEKYFLSFIKPYCRYCFTKDKRGHKVYTFKFVRENGLAELRRAKLFREFRDLNDLAFKTQGGGT
jgi:hypothetical protein